MADEASGRGALRIALISYRSKPHSGGQGVYVRHMSRALTDLGHHVEVFSGPPYPELDADIPLTEVPSLDLYREPDPFRIPKLREFRTRTDVLEYALVCTAAFPEPRTFSTRLIKVLGERAADLDVVHDNQTYGPALLKIPTQLGLPLVGTVHHPISVDRRLALDAAPWRKKLQTRRWYGFVRTQARVARQFPYNLTPSQSSADDAVREFGLNSAQLRVVPIGVDTDRFRPRGPREPGLVVSLCSADVPLKGLPVLLRAVAAVPEATLTVVAKPTPDAEKLVADLGIAHRVTFRSGLTNTEIAELMSRAEVASVPSLYEGFSLPAVEAMASGTALVASDTGALPEVVGRDGRSGVLVPPGDVAALADAVGGLLRDPARRAALGTAGRERAEERFSWHATARGTAEVYREAIAAMKGQSC